MNARTLSFSSAAGFAAAIALCAMPGSSLAQKSSANGKGWISNGSSACERFLTPDVVAAILAVPAAPVEKIDAYSCHSGGIYISLIVEDIDRFKLKLPQIVGTHPLSGVGDGAYWNAAGAISAVKGHDRGCDISVIGAPTKVRDEALGQKLGDICNKLFALN
jgi:hypothetical protein